MSQTPAAESCCQPPDQLCAVGRQAVRMVKRGAMLRHQFGEGTDLDVALDDWAQHVDIDRPTAITLLPKGAL